MNNGQKQIDKLSSFLKKAALATGYFMIFTVFILLTALSMKQVKESGSYLDVFKFIVMLLASIIFLIAFIATWEDIFEDEDE